MKAFLVRVVAVGLSACTGSTGPATATLFDNVRNLKSGEYDCQINTKRAEDNSIIAANNASRSNIARLDAQ